jgi:glycosyltransferase involved in cell wall biosynthesis
MVSVVVITKDSAERLGRCLDLLTKAPEIIVADTGSSDDTLQVAMSFGAKVCQIPWTHNFSEARTLAQEYATHDLVMRLDDDEFLRGADGLAEIMTLAQSHPAGICVKRTQPSPASGSACWSGRLMAATVMSLPSTTLVAPMTPPPL